MPPLKQTYGSTNPLLTKEPVSWNTPGAMAIPPGGGASMAGPVAPTLPKTTATTTTPNVPAPSMATSNVPNTNASQLEQIRQQALAIQAQIPGLKEPTIGQSFKSPTLEGQEVFKSSNLTSKEEEAIRRNQLKMYQKEINATNQVYDQMLREATTQGQGRLGSTTALGARAGILGSDFAQAQTDTVQTYNRQINAGIGAERAAKVASIMGLARQSAVDEIAKKNLARKQDADALIEWHKTKDERRTKNLETLAGSLLQQGIDPTELDTKTINDIAKSYGITKEDINFAYTNAKTASEAKAAEEALKTKKTEAEIGKLEADTANAGMFNLSEGQSRYDAQGNVIASKAKTYAPGTGTGTVPAAVAGTIRDRLESLRGQDTYTNTQEYLNEYSSFVEAGGSPEQFMKSFDPNKYINPNDPTKGWLESQMKKVNQADPLDALIAQSLAEALIPQE